MVRRIVSIVLCLMLLAQQLPVAGFMPADFDTEEALRLAILGDASWQERFPNGLINFMGTRFEAHETNTSLEIPIMRQGGTTGRVTVDLKAIGIQAQYGEDYVIRLYENAEKYQIAVTGNDSEPLVPLGNADEPILISIASPSGIDAGVSTATEAAITVAEQTYTDLPPSDVESESWPVSLRQAREAYLGQDSDRPDWVTADSDTAEGLKSESDAYLRNLPGTEATIVFEEGEYLKYLYIVPLNDTMAESEEQILLALSNPAGGASRGEFDQAYVNLVDDEAHEPSRFEILTPTVVAENEKAEITVRRSGGIAQFAAVKIGTETGTALSGVDYDPGLSELLFTPGMETQKVYVTILDNPDRKEIRQFVIALDRENRGVDRQSAEALVTLLPVSFPPSGDATTHFQTVRTVQTLAAADPTGLVEATATLLPADTAEQRAGAEMLTAQGFSTAKGTWTISGADFAKDSWLENEPIVPNYGNGLKYEFTGKHNAANVYPFWELGGVNSVSFQVAQSGVGSCGSAFYVADYSANFTDSITMPFNTPQLRSVDWKNAYNLRIGAWTSTTSSKIVADYRDVTLHLKPIATKLSPPEGMFARYNYIVENGQLKQPAKVEDRIYKTYTPAKRFYIKSVHSNVGNYQELPQDPTVYRSDRLEFGYEYSEDNPGGIYAQYDGFQVKAGTTWHTYYGSELLLDINFFRKAGIKDAMAAGTLEIRPVFSQRGTSLTIDSPDLANGWLANFGNQTTKSLFLGYIDIPDSLLLRTLNIGDVIRDLKAETRYASKQPVWTSRSMMGFSRNLDYDTTPQSVVITDEDSGAIVDYHVEDVGNVLSLRFSDPSLIVAADPSIYKQGVTAIVYTVDGVECDWPVFTAKMTQAYANGENPLVKMRFTYAFPPATTARLTVYDKNGKPRTRVYTADCSNNSFSFSLYPKAENWLLDDFATIILEGTNSRGVAIQTQETVIDFLSSAQHGVAVSRQGDSTTPALTGNVHTPVVLENANPLAMYRMLALTYPGFATAWYDKSPDANGDGQVDQTEYDKALNRLHALGFNVANLENIMDINTYWGGNFAYQPRFFNPSRIYYSFEKVTPAIDPYKATLKLTESFKTVLGNSSANMPILEGEAYINGKQVLDVPDVPGLETETVPNGIYVTEDDQFKNNNLYLGQLYYRNQIYNFAALAGGVREINFVTSDLMRPIEFKASLDGVTQKLNATTQDLRIVDGTTRFEYRFDYAKAGVKPNASIIHIYKDVFYRELMTEIKVGAPYGDLFSLELNAAELGIKAGCTMAIAGAVADNAGNILHTYPEVRVGFTFAAPLTGLTVLSSFGAPVKPVVSMLGKINNAYDLGMDVNMLEKKSDLSQLFKEEYYYDQNKNLRQIRTVTYGYNGTYAKVFSENTKDTPENETGGGNQQDVKNDAESEEDATALATDIKTKTEGASPKKKSSGGGDFNLSYTVAIAVNLELGQAYDTTTKMWAFTGHYYFSSLVLTATATADYHKSRVFVTPVGIPVTVTLTVGGDASAMVSMEADHTTPYLDKYNLSDDSLKGNVSLNPANYDLYTKFILQPHVILTASAGEDGLDISLTGAANFNFTFDTPIFGGNTHSSGSGDLRITADLKMTIAFVTKSWSLYDSKRIDLFSYGLNLQNAVGDSLQDPYRSYLYESLVPVSDMDILPRNNVALKGEWNHSAEEGLPQGVHEGQENVLQTGVFQNPQTKLTQLPDGRMLLLFVEDDMTRGDRDRAALMYSIVDGDSATPPVVIDPDGTWDESPDLCWVENKLLVTWTDASRRFASTDTQVDILSAMDISGALFDPVMGAFGLPFPITRTVPGGDAAGDAAPRVSYDASTKRLMVYYAKTDYLDRWTAGTLLKDPETVPHDEEPALLYGDIVNGYRILAYRYAQYQPDTGNFVWNDTYTSEALDPVAYYGQRFLALAPLTVINEVEHQIPDAAVDGPTHTGTVQTVEPYTGLQDPRVVDFDVMTHNGNALLAYTLDNDEDRQTHADQQLYLQVYNGADNTFSPPVDISGSRKTHTSPRFVRSGERTWLYWLRDGALVYMDVDDLFAPGRLKTLTSPGGALFQIIDKTDVAMDAHVKTAIVRDHAIDEYQIAAKGNAIYAMWTEERARYRNGLSAGDPGTEDMSNLNRERQIFAACTLPNELNTFPWSKPIQVTRAEEQRFSDLSFSVLEHDEFMVAYARHVANVNPDAGTLDSDTALHTLAINRFVITNDMELGDVVLSAAVPEAGSTVMATAGVTNTGLLPFTSYETQLFVTRNGLVSFEGEWMPALQTGASLLGGGSSTATGHFEMPQTLDDVTGMTVGFRIRDSHGNLLAERAGEIPVAPILYLDVVQSELTGADKATLTLLARNAGNKDFTGNLTVRSGERNLHTQPQTLLVQEAEEVTLDVALDGAAFGTLQMAADGGLFDALSLDVQMGNGSAVADVTRHISAEMAAAMQNAGAFVVTDGSRTVSSGGRLRIRPDEVLTMKAVTGESEDAANQLETIWQSSNPDIVTVLENGLMVPLSEGSATVTATLRPISRLHVSYPDGSQQTLATPFTIPSGIIRSNQFTVDVGFPTTTPGADDVSSVQVGGGETLYSPGSLRTLAEQPESRIVFTSAAGTATLTRAAMDELMTAAAGRAVVFSFVVHDTDIQWGLRTAAGQPIELSNGVVLSVPHASAHAVREEVLVFEVDENGNRIPVPLSWYDADAGMMQFQAYHAGTYVIGESSVPFTDALGWAREHIMALAARGIVKGTSENVFNKDKPVTRAEFITMLARMADAPRQSAQRPSPDTATSFEDVGVAAWYAVAVQWGVTSGIIQGTGATTFSPGSTLSREEMAVILYRFMLQRGLLDEAQPSPQGGAGFTDTHMFSIWAESAIREMQATGMMVGAGDGLFRPQGMSTRAEAAKVMTELLRRLLR